MKKLIAFFCFLVFAAFNVAFVLTVRALSVPALASRNTMKIVVDAGHGGIDGGVTGIRSQKKESEINLEIALKLKAALSDAGFEVVLTRKTDAGLYRTATSGFKKRDMLKRKEIIESAAPALVLSVHQNFYPLSSVRGGQAFYKKDDDTGKRLAACLQRRLNDFYLQKNVKARTEAVGDYYLLNSTSVPSTIVEFGFLSNAQDERLLLSDDGQSALVSAATAGVLDYFSEYAV